MFNIRDYFGDWGLGIGDCPIPNPQSPIPNEKNTILLLAI